MKPSFAHLRRFLYVTACASALCASAMAQDPAAADLLAAQQAVERADRADADQYAPDTIALARQQLEQAQRAAGDRRERKQAPVLAQRAVADAIKLMNEANPSEQVIAIKSLEAFAQRDRVKAEWVIDRDDVVDDLFDAVKGELIGSIRQNADNGEAATDLLMVAKYFERIGDHATNIAQWAIFAMTGERPKD